MVLRKIKQNLLVSLLSICSVYSIITCDLPDTQEVSRLFDIEVKGRDVFKSLGGGFNKLHQAVCGKTKPHDLRHELKKDFVKIEDIINVKTEDVNFSISSPLKQHESIIKKLVGSTPLFLAALIHSPEKLELLRDKGADINIEGPNGNTVLHAAVANVVEDDESQIVTIELLLNIDKQLPNKQNNAGQTPVRYMTSRNPDNTEQRQRIEKMLKFEDYFLPLPQESDLHEWRKKIVPQGGRLAECVADTDLGFDGFNFWHLLACGISSKLPYLKELKDKLNIYNVTEELFKKILNTQSGIALGGATIEEKNCKKIKNILRGSTPLFLAALVHNKEMVEFFLNSGADAHIPGPGGNTVLHAAVANVDNSQDQIEIVRLLLAKDSELIKQKNKSGQTPLEYMNSRGSKSNELERLLKGAEQASLQETVIPSPVAEKKSEAHVSEDGSKRELNVKLENLAKKLLTLREKLQGLAQKLMSLEGSLGKTAKKQSIVAG